MYIIGDALNRGSQSIPLIQDIMRRKNVILLKGNHELMALPTFDNLMYQSRETQKEIIQDELAIAAIGQEETLRDFCTLSTQDQIHII